MFDLERAIAEWRRELSATGIDSPDVLDELEGHLREGIDALMRSGTRVQPAFHSAVRGLGSHDGLKAEFKKISRAGEALERLMRVVRAILTLLIVGMSGYTFLKMGLSPSEQMVAYAGVAATLVAACAWRHAVPFLPVLASPGKRIASGLLCIGAGIVFSNLFCHFLLPRFETYDGQIPAIGFWAVFPIALFACLGLALMMSADDRKHWKMMEP